MIDIIDHNKAVLEENEYQDYIHSNKPRLFYIGKFHFVHTIWTTEQIT